MHIVMDTKTRKLFQYMRQKYTSLYEIVDFSLFITMLLHVIVIPTIFQALDKQTTAQQQQKDQFLSHFSSFLTV